MKDERRMAIEEKASKPVNKVEKKGIRDDQSGELV
jgi:hypothetical protein